jgi:hypothetical protein
VQVSRDLHHAVHDGAHELALREVQGDGGGGHVWGEIVDDVVGLHHLQGRGCAEKRGKRREERKRETSKGDVGQKSGLKVTN